MPSAAKKRKAAKKKKEKEANLDISINDSLGNEDVKSQDEKGSDGGELISPSSQDHHNDQTPFHGVEKSDQPPVLQNVAEEDSTNVISAAETDYLLGKILSIDHIESVKESKECKNEGSSSSTSSSSSSSSEDESHVTDSKSADHNLVLRPKTSDSSSAEVIPMTEILSSQIEVMNNSTRSGDCAAVKTIYIAENEAVESFLSTPNEAPKTSAASTDLTLEESREKVEEKGSEDLPYSSVSNSCTSTGEQLTQHYEIPEDSESQPLVAAPAPPRIVLRTSIFSCCGLFDALTGSNR